MCRRGSVGESHVFFETNLEREIARGWWSSATSLWREREVSCTILAGGMYVYGNCGERDAYTCVQKRERGRISRFF